MSTKLTGGLGTMAKQRKVEVVTGVAKFTGPKSIAVDGREIKFDSCIIAAGSSAVKLPFLPDDPRIIDSTGALSPDDVPGRFLVIGGGIIGLEMATVYHALGAKVTVVEMLDQLIPGADADLVRPLHNRVKDRYAGILLGTQVTAVKASKSGLRVSFSEGKDQTFDRILVAVGRTPNGRTLDADKAGVNVDERGFIPVDRQHAHQRARHLRDRRHRRGPDARPQGDARGQDRGRGHRRSPGSRIRRADGPVGRLHRSRGRLDGPDRDRRQGAAASSTRRRPSRGLPRAARSGSAGPRASPSCCSSPETDRLLGAGIVGIGAGDLIAETVLALEAGLNAQDIALAIHPHPTLSETIAFAAEMQDGSITDLLPPRSGARSARPTSEAGRRCRRLRRSSHARPSAAAG